MRRLAGGCVAALALSLGLVAPVAAATWTVTDRCDGTLTIIGDAANDEIVLASDASGKLSHNRFGVDPGLVSPADLDSSVEGEQSKTVSCVTSIVVNGLGGNDSLDLSALREIPAEIDGGDGDDRLIGGSGRDLLIGGTGMDQITAECCDPHETTGDGRDQINGGPGNDTIDGGLGDDEIDGGEGNDDVSGGAGNDSINGGGGSDVLDGGTGNDTIRGRYIFASVTLDFITVTGGPGNDTLDFSLLSAGVSINLDKLKQQTVFAAGASGGVWKITFVDLVENLVGTSFGDRIVAKVQTFPRVIDGGTEAGRDKLVVDARKLPKKSVTITNVDADTGTVIAEGFAPLSFDRVASVRLRCRKAGRCQQ
jgi:Ca2+-binding RTX toxin-like protein